MVLVLARTATELLDLLGALVLVEGGVGEGGWETEAGAGACRECEAGWEAGREAGRKPGWEASRQATRWEREELAFVKVAFREAGCCWVTGGA